MNPSAQECYQTNVQSLETIYPGLAKTLHETNLVEDTNSILEDATFAQNEINNHWDDKASLHLLVQVGSSDIALQLFERILDSNLLQHNNRRLLICDNNLANVKRWLHLYDIRPLLHSDRCLFAIDSKAQHPLQRILSLYPDIAITHFALYRGEANTDPTLIDNSRKFIEQYRQAVQSHLHTLSQRDQHQPRLPYPKRIRFFAAGHNIFQDACVSAFKKMGYDSKRLAWKQAVYRFVRGTAWAYEHKNNPIDTAFFLNATPKTFGCDQSLTQFDIKKISWFVDNPQRYITCKDDVSGCDALAVFDKAYQTFLRKHSQLPVIELRTGYGIDEHLATTKESFENIPIAFVGELGTHGFLPIEQRLAKRFPDWVERCNQFLQECDLRKAILMEPIAKKYFSQFEIPYQGSVVEYIENKATALRRRYYLEALKGMPLHIFGNNEWSGPFAGKLAPHYAGQRLDYYKELPSLYATAQININIYHIQSVTAPNPRVYDILACGGFLLTTYNAGLEDEFVPGEHLVCFHNKEELREKVDYYLAHPDERIAIAKNGQKQVLAHCGYSDRLQTLLHLLSKREGEPYVNIC